jgi:hypothetical protein
MLAKNGDSRNTPGRYRGSFKDISIYRLRRDAGFWHMPPSPARPTMLFFAQ